MSQLPSTVAPTRANSDTEVASAPLEPVVELPCATLPLLPAVEFAEVVELPAIDAGGLGKGNDLFWFDSTYRFVVGILEHFPMGSRLKGGLGCASGRH